MSFSSDASVARPEHTSGAKFLREETLEIANPSGSLILDSSNNLYGVAAGGNSCTVSLPNGCGVAYTYSSKVSALYRFRGQPDGANPVGGLVWDTAGNLYGAEGAS
jgi:hypothetical protein